ncbi:protein-tyrosine phosphatase family protein [Desulfofustis glycolicus]|uniref:Dual specificity phosphatase, catalytic domain n=1 Tax=Desulfofustis glycolicus DSM 9705 TaxID=1121409 RepID=A0A1M5W8J2_9BACT|nr:dual specificity protein phosphatase [Desulfofustis glycolicus]SHH83899.1 Dual specificity phosphatase, catalytic domain [Desulfofustis glycolicus DSM 9705]
MTQSAYRVDWITDNLAVGQAPMSYDALDAIRDLGIGAVLNLCAEFCDLHWIQAKAGFEVYYLPIPDEEAPDLSELEKALDWLDECLYLGKKVLVHCRFGIGRTGTVVNAYLLRKGLGHRLAGKTLKGLRSQPANFNQWWFIRKYGKKEKRLTIREPSLESKHLVDLFPFFANYEQELARIDEALQAESSPPSCGRDHDSCCKTPLTLSFIETVYLSHMVNTTLERQARLDLIDRTTAKKEAEQKGTVPFSSSFSPFPPYRCPLNPNGTCLVYAGRPAACRLSDLEPGRRRGIKSFVNEQLERLSGDIYFAFTSRFPTEAPLSFALTDAVSGRYVQTLFHHLLPRNTDEPEENEG